MSKKNKKNTKNGKLVITGYELMKHSGGFMPPACRTGAHMTEKDRPRKKVTKRNMSDYM